MDNRLVIEVIAKGKGHQFHRLTAAQFTVGRAYDNDIILEDPYVCPHHLAFERSENGWFVTVLSQVNGIQYDYGKMLNLRDLQPGDTLHVGKTKLRLLAADTPVAPAIPLLRHGGLTAWLGRPLGSLLLLALVAGWWFGLQYNASAFEFQPEKVLSTLVFMSLIPICWAGGWALLGRLLHHEMRFFEHLWVSIIAVFGMVMMGPAEEYLGYISSNHWMKMGAGLAVIFVAVAWLFHRNLLLATELKRRRRQWTSVMVAASLVVLMVLMTYAERSDFNPRPTYMAVLRPPVWNLSLGVDQQQFLEDAESVFTD